MYRKIKNKINNLIFNKIEYVINNHYARNVSNLESAIKKYAIDSTAQYVSLNCYKVYICRSKIELYDFIINEKLIINKYYEFGVWQGYSINYFSKHFPSLAFLGFDSFEGLPVDWRPGFGKGMFNLDGMLPQVNHNVNLVKGWFDKTLPDYFFKGSIVSGSFFHIDCDIYESTKIILNTVGQMIQNESGYFYILFDEYFNYPYWQNHEFKAFQEFIFSNTCSYEYIAMNIEHEQVLVKVSYGLNCS